MAVAAVVGWYAACLRALKGRFRPELLVSLLYGNPGGGGGEAARQSGLNAVITDIETGANARLEHWTLLPVLFQL